MKLRVHLLIGHFDQDIHDDRKDNRCNEHKKHLLILQHAKRRTAVFQIMQFKYTFPEDPRLLVHQI